MDHSGEYVEEKGVPSSCVLSILSLFAPTLPSHLCVSAGYSEARVKLGDYYYYGYGTESSYEAAAGQYRLASDKQSNPQAMFNLAYMYEQGLGLQKVCSD